MYATNIGNSILDKWTQILKGRKGGQIRNYVAKRHHRRLKGYQVIEYYLRGDSVNCIMGLGEDQRKWWTDPGTVKHFASVFAKLTTKELKFVAATEKEDVSKGIADWTSRTKLYRAIRVAEMNASAYGDAVLMPEWDNRLKMATLRVYGPGCYMPIDDESIMLIWEDKYNRTKIYVDHYIVGKEGEELSDGKIVVKDKPIIGVRHCEFTENDLFSAMQNEQPIEELLYGKFEALPYTDIPIIHIANGYPDDEGFGVSDFETSLDIVDTYHQIISDKRKQSRFLIPPIAVSSDRPLADPDSQGRVMVPYEPGMMVWVGKEGRGFNVPDFSQMLDGADKEKKSVRLELLRTTGLTKAAFGELGDVSNLRELEIKLIYGPLDSEISDRREDRKPYWEEIKLRLQELWIAEDPDGYKERFQSTNIVDTTTSLGDIIPTDVKQMLDNLNAIADHLDNETVVREGLAITGISGDPEDIVKKVEEEGKLANGIL